MIRARKRKTKDGVRGGRKVSMNTLNFPPVSPFSNTRTDGHVNIQSNSFIMVMVRIREQRWIKPLIHLISFVYGGRKPVYGRMGSIIDRLIGSEKGKQKMKSEAEWNTESNQRKERIK